MVGCAQCQITKSSDLPDCSGGNHFHDAAAFHSVYSVLCTALLFPCPTGFPSISCNFSLCFPLIFASRGRIWLKLFLSLAVTQERLAPIYRREKKFF